MKYTKEEIMNAFEILTCTVRNTDKFGTMCKQEVLEVLNDYFNMIEKKI